MSETATKTVKVYPTSIVPKGEKLEPVRTAKYTASSLQVEVFHIGCFVVIFAFIFAGIWKAALRAEKAEAKDTKKGMLKA
ncbi:hypothetical protein HBN50_10780 [Halobacteriovorax sp. GB3]|uniref:hypothetical protein n=1 Tax=Halobacteriovorax sp. GB3 TaxID=2719615 RepID=UPI002361E6BF|nr:hypothetical protein [Halobacteriovorax sp. GB3]MDD0853587.1 hypothetical protein [Halobacteriovorax sp. GB3]